MNEYDRALQSITNAWQNLSKIFPALSAIAITHLNFFFDEPAESMDMHEKCIISPKLQHMSNWFKKDLLSV